MWVVTQKAGPITITVLGSFEIVVIHIQEKTSNFQSSGKCPEKKTILTCRKMSTESHTSVHFRKEYTIQQRHNPNHSSIESSDLK